MGKGVRKFGDPLQPDDLRLVSTVDGCCRCGQETRVIPRMLQLRQHWVKAKKESVRLEEAGLTKEVMSHVAIA